MDKNKILAKEKKIKKEERYFYVKNEKSKIEHQGESVNEFLARGGSIKRIIIHKIPKKNENGKFIKGSMIEIQERNSI